MLHPLLGAAVWAVTSAAQPPGQGLTLVADGKSDYVIVVAANAPPATRRGATELQQHLLQMSGATLAIVDDSTPLAAHAVLVGASKYAPPLDLAAMLEDGFMIRTDGERLYLAGPGKRGTMYACSTFLESLGVRWFTPSVTVIPHRATVSIPATYEKQKPAFEYREPFFFEAFDRDWAARNKTNGNSQHLDEAVGGRVAYSDFVHTFDTFIPQALHAEHPEYFPFIGGKRASGYVQRCLTNPDVLRLTIEGVKKSFKDHPEATICSVSQNDCGNWCQCEQCAKLTAQYGAHSGLYLWFVNQVAGAIEKDLPGKLIDTLAYQFTEAPPKAGTITLRPNVRVRLCPISVCESHAYEHDDHPATKAFVENLKAWSRLTNTLYIWHYNTDFAHYLMPFPDFDEFPADTRLYQRYNVRGVFFEGAYAPGGGGAEAELRSWVMARVLWNPRLDADALVTEWMQGVYGDAWKPMRQWHDLLHAKVREPGRHLSIYDPPKADLFTPEIIAKGDALFDEAAALAKTDVQKRYIAKARLGLRYVKLFLAPRVDMEFASFVADVRAMGITQISEGGTVDAWEQDYRRRHATEGEKK